MNNRIDAGVEFSYQGQTHALRATIDLDLLMAADPALPDFHLLLARANAIDTYSYLYEVMESHEVVFANATGIAAECLEDGVFNAEAFVHRWQERQQAAVLGPIARRNLQVEDLDRHPALRQALLEAYNAGKAAGR